MAEWQPIETMPAEGQFLVYMPEEFMKVQAARKNKRGILVIGSSFDFELTRPTHWQPLPPPPQTKPLLSIQSKWPWVQGSNAEEIDPRSELAKKSKS